MRLKPSLNVTPGGSLTDISAAVDRERKNQLSKEGILEPPQKQHILKFQKRM